MKAMKMILYFNLHKCLSIVVILLLVITLFGCSNDTAKRQVTATIVAREEPTNAPRLTPTLQPLATISFENVAQLTELARMDKGELISCKLAYSLDGKLLGMGTNGGVYLYNAQTLAEVRLLSINSKYCASIALSPDGTILATSYEDYRVQLWRVSDGKLLNTLEGHTDWVNSMTFSADSSTLASGSGDTTIRLWQVADGQLLTSLEGHTGGVSSVSISADLATLASGSDDNTIRLWRVADGLLLHILEGHTREVHSVSFSYDSATLASGSDGPTIRLWRVADGQLLHAIDTGTGDVMSVSFSADSAILASGSWGLSSSQAGIRLWRVADGQPIVIDLEENTDWVSRIRFSSDGMRLVSMTHDGTLRLWGVVP